jgi:N-acyl-D-amino-acid deacylase
MTGLVADHFVLRDRGYVKPGCFADLVFVDPARIGELATWRLPNAHPAGVDQVYVKGALAWSNGESTGALAGRMLTRTS